MTRPETERESLPPAGPFFFAEKLPKGPEDETPAAIESRVLLDLETGAPLPVEKLAYGWVRLPSGEPLYYAAPRAGLPAHDATLPLGEVLPDAGSIVLPKGVSPADFLSAQRDFHADLRPRPALAAMRVAARTDAALARLAMPLKIAAALAFALLLAAGALAAVNTTDRRRLAAQEPAITEAGKRSEMLATIERVNAVGHSVFDALAVVGPSRPEGLIFKRVIFTGGRELSIEGEANAAGLVNEMDSKLRDLKLFESGQPTLRAASGRTHFTVKYDFKKWPQIVDVPTDVAAPPVVAPPPKKIPPRDPGKGGRR